MNKDEALKLALEALEMCEVPWTGTLDHNLTKAITAIKQALAAPPMHKPVRWTDEEYREISDQVISTLVEYGAELRTADCQMQILREELAESRREVAQLKAQRQWVGLTNAALDKKAENARELGLDYEPVQEPVAWRWKLGDSGWQLEDTEPSTVQPKAVIEPLYTTPPAANRPWVGLTDEDIDEIFDHWPTYNLDHSEFAQVVEAKLKEKNNV